MRLLGAALLPYATSRGQQTVEICNPPAAGLRRLQLQPTVRGH